MYQRTLESIENLQGSSEGMIGRGQLNQEGKVENEFSRHLKENKSALNLQKLQEFKDCTLWSAQIVSSAYENSENQVNFDLTHS